MLVSVVIPTYGRLGYLASALQSVRNQSYSNYEMIVVDDNTDTARSLNVKKLCVRFNAKYIKNYKSKGGCGARNSGILSAKGDVIAFLDDDDVWHPEKLVRQLEYMESNDNAVAVYCNYYIYHESVDAFKRISGAPSTMSHRDLLKGNCPASTSLIMIRREVLIKYQNFDEELPSFQDYDMWLRVTKSGDMHCVNQELVVFRQHSGERVSINIVKRLAGLTMILEKWGSEISSVTSAASFKRNFLSSAYINYANVAPTYLDGLYYSAKAVITSPLNWRLWVNTLMMFLGNSFVWKIKMLRNVCGEDEKKEILRWM